jgi:hypothetical protein
MVRWYDPRVLMQTAYQVVISNIFGRSSDTRVIEALASQQQRIRLLESGRLWLDYAADIGEAGIRPSPSRIPSRVLISRSITTAPR